MEPFCSEGLLGLSLLTSMKTPRKSLSHFPKGFDCDMLFTSLENGIPGSVFCKPLRCWPCIHTTGGPGGAGAHFTGRPRVLSIPFQSSTRPLQGLLRPFLCFPLLSLHSIQMFLKPQASYQPRHLPPAQAGPGKRHCRQSLMPALKARL